MWFDPVCLSAPSFTPPPLLLTTLQHTDLKAFPSDLHMTYFFLLIWYQLRHHFLREIFLTFLTQITASSGYSVTSIYFIFLKYFSPAVIISYVYTLTNLLPIPSSLECQPHTCRGPSLFTAVSQCMTHLDAWFTKLKILSITIFIYQTEQNILIFSGTTKEFWKTLEEFIQKALL